MSLASTISGIGHTAATQLSSLAKRGTKALMIARKGEGKASALLSGKLMARPGKTAATVQPGAATRAPAGTTVTPAMDKSESQESLPNLALKWQSKTHNVMQPGAASKRQEASRFDPGQHRAKSKAAEQPAAQWPTVATIDKDLEDYLQELGDHFAATPQQIQISESSQRGWAQPEDTLDRNTFDWEAKKAGVSGNAQRKAEIAELDALMDELAPPNLRSIRIFDLPQPQRAVVTINLPQPPQAEFTQTVKLNMDELEPSPQPQSIRIFNQPQPQQAAFTQTVKLHEEIASAKFIKGKQVQPAVLTELEAAPKQTVAPAGTISAPSVERFEESALPPTGKPGMPTESPLTKGQTKIGETPTLTPVAPGLA